MGKVSRGSAEQGSKKSKWEAVGARGAGGGGIENGVKIRRWEQRKESKRSGGVGEKYFLLSGEVISASTLLYIDIYPNSIILPHLLPAPLSYLYLQLYLY